MAKGTFGEHLKREREMRGVSLEEISSATRIGTRFLEALESEQWDRLPGGVFNRGFVRAVARFLGLDEESLVAEYVLATNERPGVAIWAEGLNSRRTGARLLPWLLILLAIAIAAGGWFAWRRYAGWRAARAIASSGGSASAPTQTAVAVPPAPASDTPALTAPPGPPVSATTSSSPATQASPPVTFQAAEPAELELSVSAGMTTTVKVAADGKSVFDGKMTADQTQHFTAKDRFEVSTRDSGALFLELNGQTVAPIGPPGSPGRITLTRKDLKKSSGGPD